MHTNKQTLYKQKLTKGLNTLRRLTAIHSTSGIPLFDMKFKNKEKLCDDMLYSGLIRTLSLILDEATNSGFVNQIALERGHIVITRIKKHNLTFAVLADEYSTDVHEFLDDFSGKFLKKFEQYLKNPTNTRNFDDAAQLLNSFSQSVCV